MKDIDKIISFLDEQIERQNQRELTPVEAGELLDKAGILKDSETSKGKPLREILRDGKIPHAYQIGARWHIPHSKKLLSNQILERPIQQDILQHIQIDTKDVSNENIESFKFEYNLKKVADLDEKDIPEKSGLYMICVNDIKSLPEVFANILKSRNHKILYIGVATKSLRKRLWKQELHAKGHGTFFRSLGAILGYVPQQGSLRGYKNKNNYEFSFDDEQRIIRWIECNLSVSYVVNTQNLKSEETDLIIKHLPLINIQKNPLQCKELIILRQRCKEIADS